MSSTIPPTLRQTSAPAPAPAPAPPKPSSAGPPTLGHLPRKPGAAKRAPPLGLLAHPGPPSALGFAKQAAAFGRVGGEPASPVEKAKRIGAPSPLLGSPTRARRLGSFNSLAAPLAAPPRVDESGPTAAPAAARGVHRLRHQWVFWVLSRAPSRKMSEEEFGRAIRRLGSCDTVETFYGVYLHIKRPSAQPPITDLHLFLDPIRPVWEDPANAGGGKWTVRLRKGLADRLWETVVLSLVGGSLEKLVLGPHPAREICGAVLSVRRDEDILAVWHRSGSPEAGADGKMAKQVKLALQTVLQLPLTCNLVYKLNADSLASGTTNGHHHHHHKFSPPELGANSIGGIPSQHKARTTTGSLQSGNPGHHFNQNQIGSATGGSTVTAATGAGGGGIGANQIKITGNGINPSTSTSTSNNANTSNTTTVGVGTGSVGNHGGNQKREKGNHDYYQ